MGPPTPDIVIYYLVGTSLVRRECQNGTLESDNAVASNVASVNVACSPTADCSGNPTSITVTITETPTASGPQYVYSLTGTFQKNIGTGSPASVVLLGGGTCGANAGINISGSGQMRVYGDAYLNTKDNGASCGAITLSGGATYAAGIDVDLERRDVPGAGVSRVPSRDQLHDAAPRPVLDDGAAVHRRPPEREREHAVPDARIHRAYPACTRAHSSITNDHNCQLQSGVYILQGGLSVSGSAALTSAAPGVLLYITGGSLDVGGSGSVNISPLTTGPWAGILVWQDKLDTGTISYSGASPLTLNGIVYAPTAQLNISGSAANPTLFALVVKSVFISGTGKIFVGNPSSTPLSIGTPPTDDLAGRQALLGDVHG